MDSRAWRRLPALALSASLVACTGSGLGDILGGTGGQPQGGTVTVEVQQVQQSRQEIVVRTQDGQQGPILYDANTQVVYNNEQFPVTALERGDIVDMRIQQVQEGYYTDLIQVRTPVQERTGAGGTGGTTDPGIYKIEGTVGQIDAQNARFTLNMTQGGTVTIGLPGNASASDRERLQEMLPGDYVRVEVRPIDQERAELVRFGWS